ITSDTLSVVELRNRIAEARVQNLTPINLYALSLSKAASQPQELSVRIENQMNRPVSVELSLQGPGQIKTKTSVVRIPVAKLVEARVPWPGAQLATNNQYPIQLQARVLSEDGAPLTDLSHSQIIQVAQFVKHSPQVDGKLDDWKDLTPVFLTARPREDFTKFLLNPNLRPDGNAPTLPALARIFTAYDDHFVYVAVAGWGTNCNVGQPAKPGLPFLKGDPKGLNYISTCGDVVQVAFGFRDRVPGQGRQMQDPWAWKGLFYDTDYQYAAHTSPEGPKLIRLWGAETDRRTAYQIDEVPHIIPVEGARIAITGEAYEIAIPRRELRLFDPAKDRLRFSVVLNNRNNWADTAGVFDYWSGMGSFGPSWESRLPCQTFFGIHNR
ncbi:MAG TPA: hypothetical protein VEC99_06920, partial [Clostridia bacterium]|nr:hypothetical protein [Clostridia bacterium]